VTSNLRASSGVAEATYRRVIENAISGVENLPIYEAEKYLRNEWLPYARDVQATWQAAEAPAPQDQRDPQEGS
jgi:hypothetical protein